MTRISLRETYDNRSVIAQIAKVTDTAEDAAETVQEKTAEINDAITEVNAAVQAAEGAVTTANAASASAQQSAQTVAGYNTRLTTAEGEIDTLQSDLNSVTLRVQTAEGNIVTIQGQVTALQTADGQNVKLTGEHAIGNYAVLLTGNQTSSGNKTHNGELTIVGQALWQPRFKIKTNNFNQATPPSSTVYGQAITWTDVNDVEVARIYVQQLSSGKFELFVAVKDATNTYQSVKLI